MWLRHWVCRPDRLARRARHAPLAAAAFAALALTACANGDPVVTGSVAAPSAQPASQTIAFDSVDGPPKPVFDRLVTALSTEAEARELPVVSRNTPATWRVRAYLATHVEKKKNRAVLSWAWDVFDADRKLAFRLAGEKPLGVPTADVWAQCDDALLARIAATGFDALAARLAPSPRSPEEPRESEPQSTGIAVASAAGRQSVAFAESQR